MMWYGIVPAMLHTFMLANVFLFTSKFRVSMEEGDSLPWYKRLGAESVLRSIYLIRIVVSWVALWSGYIRNGMTNVVDACDLIIGMIYTKLGMQLIYVTEAKEGSDNSGSDDDDEEDLLVDDDDDEDLLPCDDDDEEDLLVDDDDEEDLLVDDDDEEDLLVDDEVEEDLLVDDDDEVE